MKMNTLFGHIYDNSAEERGEKMKEAQPLDPDGKIMFMNDSLPTDFQIFRLHL